MLLAVCLSYIFLVLCGRSVSLANILDGRKCLLYEELVTEPLKIEEDIKFVVFNSKLKPITRVQYNQHVRLTCDMQIPFSMNITWRARSKELKSGLSEDRKELDIKHVDFEYHGEYITCEAKLMSNPRIVKTFGTNIRIIDLTPPLIREIKPSNIAVMENDKIMLTCKIIAGIPQPNVSWQLKTRADSEFRDLIASGEELLVDNTTFADDGQYRCIAKNVMGQDNRTFDVAVQKMPVASIKGKSEKTIPYGNTTDFPCKVDGYPMPKTIWHDSQGNELRFEDNIINWHEKTSRLELRNMKKSNSYSCFVENKFGEAVVNVSVTVLSPFVVHERPEKKTNVHYGALSSIICNITSSFPMKIKWFHPKSVNSSELIEILTDNMYEITSNGTVLRIAFTNLDAVGYYTCEASLISDENEKIDFTTDVVIDNLASPILSGTNKIVVMEKNWITLSCKISAGVPRPTLSWQVMKHGDTTYKNLPTSSEDLDVENITIADAGMYRCEAENPIGKQTQVTEVLVRKSPVTDIVEGSEATIIYGSSTSFTCKVVGYPLPSVEWTDGKGMPVKEITEDYIVHQHERSSKITKTKILASDTYFCNAKNSLGEAQSSIHIIALPAFIVHQYPPETTNVHYKASTNLVCNITSSLPMTIKWFHNTFEIHTSAKHTISANKTVLTINSVDLDLIGNYTCEASLIRDTIVEDDPKEVFSSNVQIDDLRPPVITSNSGPMVTIKNLEELTLACKATGYPDPIVTWTHNYQTIGEGDSICSTNFGSAQAGTYKCSATNIAGEDSRLIYVSVTY